MKAIHVNIIGAGGTGAWAAEQIMRSVIGMRSNSNEHAVIINLIDNDRVELKNLVRQHFIGVESIGMAKVEYLRMKLERILAAALFSVDGDLMDSTGAFMPGIRIDSHEQLVLENEEGELPPLINDILFPQNSTGAINVMCVDNNLTRKAVEKHYHKHIAETNSVSKFDAFVEGSATVAEVLDAIADEDLGAKSVVYYVPNGDTIVAKIVTESSNGAVHVSKPIPAEYMRSLTHAECPAGAPMCAYIDAGNDDTDFAINGALNTRLADYTAVYDANLTVPDALLSCAIRTETTSVPQTSSMNMMAAVHLSSVVAQWIVSMRDGVDSLTHTIARPNDVLLRVSPEGPATGILLKVPGVGHRLIHAKGRGSDHLTSEAQAVRTALVNHTGKVTPAKFTKAVAACDTLKNRTWSGEDSAKVLKSVIDDDCLSYLVNTAQLDMFTDNLNTYVDGVVINGTSTTSKLLARSRQRYQLFRSLLAKSQAEKKS